MKSIIFASIFALTLIQLSLQHDRCQQCWDHAERYAASEGLPSGRFNIDDVCHKGHKWICRESLNGVDYDTLREFIERIKDNPLAICGPYLGLCKLQ